MTKVNQTTSSLRAVCLCGCISWSDGSEWGVRGWDCFIFVYFLPSLKISTDYSAVWSYSRLMDWRLMGIFFLFFPFLFSFLFPLLLSRSSLFVVSFLFSTVDQMVLFLPHRFRLSRRVGDLWHRSISPGARQSLPTNISFHWSCSNADRFDPYWKILSFNLVILW